METAEKRPLSRNAIAGFYYFSSGRGFIQAAQESIRKDAHVEGKFYISSALNEYILNGKVVRSIPIDTSKYITFYSPQKIAEFDGGAHIG